jgi:hypothetical protein
MMLWPGDDGYDIRSTTDFPRPPSAPALTAKPNPARTTTPKPTYRPQL